MNYWLYLLICWFTQPFRWLMFWWPHRNFSFAVRLLFRNNFKCQLVEAWAAHETGNFTSLAYMQYNNCFGMGSTKNSPYQWMSYNPNALGEPVRATYRTVYQSVYDIYHYIYKRSNSAVAKTFDDTPGGWAGSGMVASSYSDSFILALKKAGYYTAPYSTYNLAIYNQQLLYKGTWANFTICVLGSIIMPVSLLRWYNPRFVRRWLLPKVLNIRI